MAKPDYRDLVITDQADQLADLEAQLVDALRDRDAYRLLACAGLTRIAELTAQVERLRVCVARQVEADAWRADAGVAA